MERQIESIQPRLSEISVLLAILSRQICTALSKNKFKDESLLLKRFNNLYQESVQRRAGTWKEMDTTS